MTEPVEIVQESLDSAAPDMPAPVLPIRTKKKKSARLRGAVDVYIRTGKGANAWGHVCRLASEPTEHELRMQIPKLRSSGGRIKLIDETLIERSIVVYPEATAEQLEGDLGLDFDDPPVAEPSEPDHWPRQVGPLPPPPPAYYPPPPAPVPQTDWAGLVSSVVPILAPMMSAWLRAIRPQPQGVSQLTELVGAMKSMQELSASMSPASGAAGDDDGASMIGMLLPLLAQLRPPTAPSATAPAVAPPHPPIANPTPVPVAARQDTGDRGTLPPELAEGIAQIPPHIRALFTEQNIDLHDLAAQVVNEGLPPEQWRDRLVELVTSPASTEAAPS